MAFSSAKKTFLEAIARDEHRFSETLAFIERWFDVKASGFSIGPVRNEAEANQGSCQVLALAQQLAMTDQQALCCFGEHYREVLATPELDNHHNLRQLLSGGLNDVEFDHFPLTPKQ